MKRPTCAEQEPTVWARHLGWFHFLRHTVDSLSLVARWLASAGPHALATALWPDRVGAKCRAVLMAVLRSLMVVWGILALSQAGLAQERAPVHAFVDLGHQFTFYADGRFHRQYLPDQPVAMSWGALFHYDFANANLLVLLGCDPHLRYVAEDIRTISAFADSARASQVAALRLAAVSRSSKSSHSA